MKTWFEDWERENKISDSFYYNEKILEDEPISNTYTSKPKRTRESAHIRKRNYKANLLKKYNRSTIWGGYYSLSLYHYYMPDPDNRPTVIKPIRCEFVWCEWAVPSFTKHKKKETNRKVRHLRDHELPIIGKEYKKLFNERW